MFPLQNMNKPPEKVSKKKSQLATPTPIHMSNALKYYFLPKTKMEETKFRS